MQCCMLLTRSIYGIILNKEGGVILSELKFIVYDVQHGSCSHVITPANQHIIIDLGSKAETSICRYLKENYFRYGGTIDQLVLTHLHEDHIYDLPNLDTYGINPCILQRPRGAFPLSYKASDPNHYKRIVNKANELNEHYTGVVSDSESPVLFQNNGGVHFEFFAPPDNLCSDDPNSFSNIIVVSYGYFKIVITGDNPASILKEMLQNNIQLRQSIKDSTILVAPHHGRDGEYCEEFVSAANPRLTVFSDGTKKYKTQDYSRNRYANRTRGVTWGDQSRYVFTTRSDGSIKFSFRPDGTWSIDTDKFSY